MNTLQAIKTYTSEDAVMDKDSLAALWQEYLRTRDLEIRNTLLMYYVPLVKRVVNRLFQTTKAFNEYDDLISCGIIGLMDAIDRFNPTKGASFETYSQIRIRGEIIDYMRSLDWAPVHLRIKIKKVENAYDELSQEKGRLVTDLEVAQHLDINQCDLHEILKESHFLNVVHLEELLQDTVQEDPRFAAESSVQNSLEDQDFKSNLAREIEKLSEREKLLVSLYYSDELTLKEIGIVLGVTESRVCQIHSSVMSKLRARMKSFK